MTWWTNTTDNVVRVLSGMKPNPSFWCRINLHNWSRWELGTVNRYMDTKMRWQDGTRSCTYCNMPNLVRFVEVKRKRQM